MSTLVLEKENNVLVEELTGHELDYYVATCLGRRAYINKSLDYCIMEFTEADNATVFRKFSPSTRWAQGGSLIQLNKISIEYYGMLENGKETDYSWAAYQGFSQPEVSKTNVFGDSPLVAAMRCIVKLKYGKTIDKLIYPIKTTD